MRQANDALRADGAGVGVGGGRASEELETLKDYLEPATFKEAARVTATTPLGADWFDELDVRLGAGTAPRVAAAALEAERDGRLAFAED